MTDLKPITVDGLKYVLFSKNAARAINLETFTTQPVMFVHIAEHLTGHDRHNYGYSWQLIPLAPWLEPAQEIAPPVSPEEVANFGDAIRPTLRAILEPTAKAKAKLDRITVSIGNQSLEPHFDIESGTE